MKLWRRKKDKDDTAARPEEELRDQLGDELSGASDSEVSSEVSDRDDPHPPADLSETSEANPFAGEEPGGASDDTHDSGGDVDVTAPESSSDPFATSTAGDDSTDGDGSRRVAASDLVSSSLLDDMFGRSASSEHAGEVAQEDPEPAGAASDAPDLAPVYDEPAVGEPADGFTDEPADGFTNEPVDGFTDEPVDGFADEPVDGFADEPVDGFADEPADGLEVKPTDGLADETVDGLDAEPADGLEVKPTDGLMDETVDGFDAEPADGLEGEDATDEVEDGDATDEAEDESEPAGKLSRLRGFATVHVDTSKFRNLWQGSSVGRTALLAVIVYMLAVGGSFFLFAQPASRRLHRVKGQKDILHDYVVIEQAGAVINTFKDGLMTGDQRMTVMSEVTQMAEASGVRIVGDPELLLGRDAPGSFSEYPMRVRAKGTYHEIGNFLSLLESSARFVVVERVETRSDVDSRNSEIETTLVLALAAWEG